MTPTEQWIFGLALVYSVPSFISGVGITLLCVRWPDIRHALAMVPRLLSPKLVLERQDFEAVSLAPTDESQNLLSDGLRLR
jgi:hypothetical protein